MAGPSATARSLRTERRLRVDWIKCDGYGTCADMLPELIDVDEWRYPILAGARCRAS